MSNTIVTLLERGTLVRALRHLDKPGANVSIGERGVVFETSDFHEPGTGPMVRWFSGGACNVYEGDVERADR